MTTRHAIRHSAAAPFAKERVEAFSDGVIAVAITLLILDIRVPEPDSADTLGHQLIALWPNVLAYVISFIAIGIIWINHHTMLRRLSGVDHSTLVLNLFLLLCIVTLPFSTSLLATYLADPQRGALAAMVYAGTFLITSTIFVMLQAHLLLRRQHLLRERQSSRRTRVLLARAALAPPVYLVAGSAGLLSPYLTLGICVALGIFYLLAPPSGRRPQPDLHQPE